MLDQFTILTQSGLILWSKSFTNNSNSISPINNLISNVIIEERTSNNNSSSNNNNGDSTNLISSYEKDGYKLLWILSNKLNLIFILTYQKILRLNYVEDLIIKVESLFLNLFDKELIEINQSLKNSEIKKESNLFNNFGWNNNNNNEEYFKDWDKIFNKLLIECESAGKVRIKSTPTKSFLTKEIETISSEVSTESNTPALGTTETTLDPSTIARNILALKARQKAAINASKKGSKSPGGKSLTTSELDTGSDTDTKRKTPIKQATKWSDSKVSLADLASYDYSSDVPPSTSTSSPGPTPSTSNLISKTALGTRTKSGYYEVADYLVSENQIDVSNSTSTNSSSSSSTSIFSTLMSKLSLSPKILTSEDLAPALAAMKEHLMFKNVAKEISEKVCESVGKNLLGTSLTSSIIGGIGGIGGGSIKNEVKKALELSLIKILTPKSSTDLLLEITRKKSSSSSSSTSTSNVSNPYCITFVGVNGVGKSTNLSKVAFWLLQNQLKILIGACDTFRSGAVEQLRVHVGNLNKLNEGIDGNAGGEGKGGGGGKVELFERGYGKDAAGIAKDAIAYAKEHKFDVVLIDTAGRMQDNEPLMRALAKLVTVNNPDKIVFVGEALVGNEAVDQLIKFNRSLRDFSGLNNPRGIDGMILTKFDTIDDKVGAALSMTYVTGQPILFVGTGQTYTDLRSLRVSHIVSALLQD